MSPAAIPLLLLLLLGSSQKTEQRFQPRDETTGYDLLCPNPNVAMNFSSVRLDSIGKNFITSPMITCLELKENGIKTITTETFDSLPNLQYLQISSNRIDLDTLFLNNFEQLEVVLVDYNNLGNMYYINRNIHINRVLPKLRKLFLRDSEIDHLLVQNKSILPSLTHLYLSNNYLLEDNFDWLPNSLEYLDLASSRLNSLTLKNLNNLERLFIDNSKLLQTIAFKNLRSLKYLSASSSQINKISSQTFSNITSLEYLDLSNNEIQYIEGGSFNVMSELQFLNLSSNAIEVIQGGLFEKLSKLKILILEQNSITMFPIIGTPTVLESLSLNCNKIQTIIGGTFARMPLLETLLLHHNQITNIDQEAFFGLEKLKVLTLSNNNLSILPEHWMKPLQSLEELDLAGNHFVKFGNLALGNSLTLKNVYLSDQMLYMTTTSLVDLPINATINFDPQFQFVDQCRV